MFLTDSNIHDFLISPKSLPKRERYDVRLVKKGYYFLFCGGFSKYERFCIKQSIPFKTYERYDAGGGCGFILHVINEKEAIRIQEHFKLTKDVINSIENLQLGYAYNLDSTNCDEHFRIPSSCTFIPFLAFNNKPDRLLYDYYPYVVKKLKRTVYQVLPIEIELSDEDFPYYHITNDYFCYFGDSPLHPKHGISEDCLTEILEWLEIQSNKDGHHYSLVLDEFKCYNILPHQGAIISESPPKGGIVLLPGDEVLPEGIDNQTKDFELGKKRHGMGYLLIRRPGMEATIAQHRNELVLKSLEELVNVYNRSVEVGIVGSYQQALYLAAMRLAFLEKVGHSPITLEEGLILGLTGQINYNNGQLIYESG